MRADRAVEPTKSENITVTWRRSAVSLATHPWPSGVPTAPDAAFAVVSRFAIARSNLRRWPSRTPSFSRS